VGVSNWLPMYCPSALPTNPPIVPPIQVPRPGTSIDPMVAPTADPIAPPIAPPIARPRWHGSAVAITLTGSFPQYRYTFVCPPATSMGSRCSQRACVGARSHAALHYCVLSSLVNMRFACRRIHESRCLKNLCSIFVRAACSPIAPAANAA